MLWLTKKRRNHATAANPMTNAITVATASCGPLALIPSPTGWNASGSENSPDANTAGIASRKPNRADSSRSRPRNKPALIVAPDVDTVFPRQLFGVPGLLAVVLGGRDDDGEDDQRARDQPQIPCASTDFVLEQQTQHADRDGADDDVPAHPVVEGAVCSDEKAVEPGLEDAADVAGEVQQHRQLGAQLSDRGERRARVIVEEDARGDRQ